MNKNELLFNNYYYNITILPYHRIVINRKMSSLSPELYNHILSFRPIHPVAKIIQDLKNKCNLCMENPRYNNCECCSSTCSYQMNDSSGYFDYPEFDGVQFTRFMRL